jgi:hypothetical protein
MMSPNSRERGEQNGGHASGNCHMNNDVLAKTLVIKDNDHEGNQNHPTSNPKKARQEPSTSSTN